MLTFLNDLVSSDDRPSLRLDPSGGWAYEGTDIEAVGARDLTLGEALKPQLIVAADTLEPEAVLLPLQVVEENEKLEGLLQAGTVFEAGAESLVRIPWAVWQEHAEEPVGAWLPERDGQGLERALAVVERNLRFQKREFEETARLRQFLVLLATLLGRSRREVGEALGLSPGRVQQINDNPSEYLSIEANRFIRNAGLVVQLIGDRPCRRSDVPKLVDLDDEGFDELLRTMVQLGLLAEEPAGVYRVTGEGRDLAGLRKRRTGKTSSGRGKKVGDAAR